MLHGHRHHLSIVCYFLPNERDELELEDAEEQEDRDNQNMATSIREDQGDDAWPTSEEWTDRYEGQYLMTDNKIPSEDEPTDLRLTPGEYEMRRR